MTIPPFSAVVEQHGDMVWRVCVAVAGPDEADDAWSETFVAALRAYPGLTHHDNLAGWLATIAHRKAIDCQRARARRPQPVADVPERASVDPPAPDADVWRALRRVSLRQRQVLVYRHLVGLDDEEIAALLGTSRAAVRRSAADAAARLRTAPELSR